MKQIGVATQIYLTDNDDVYCPAYYYNLPNGPGSLDDSGINHWSGLLMPYVKNLQIFVSPADKIGGQCPTNYIGNNQGYGCPSSAVSGNPAVQDNQAPRISYTANEAIMPRPRGSVGGTLTGQPQNVVSATAVDDVSELIALAHFTDYLNAVSGGGPGGVKFKSHRPFDMFALDAAGTIPYDTSNTNNSPIYAIEWAAAKLLFAAQASIPFGSGAYPHLVYTHVARFDNGNNYMYADTHAKFKATSATLSCQTWQYGRKAYNQGSAPVLCPSTGLPL